MEGECQGGMKGDLGKCLLISRVYYNGGFGAVNVRAFSEIFDVGVDSVKCVLVNDSEGVCELFPYPCDSIPHFLRFGFSCDFKGEISNLVLGV